MSQVVFCGLGTLLKVNGVLMLAGVDCIALFIKSSLI